MLVLVGLVTISSFKKSIGHSVSEGCIAVAVVGEVEVGVVATPEVIMLFRRITERNIIPTRTGISFDL